MKYVAPVKTDYRAARAIAKRGRQTEAALGKLSLWVWAPKRQRGVHAAFLARRLLAEKFLLRPRVRAMLPKKNGYIL